MTTAALLVSVGLVLQYAESVLPVFSLLPGGKLGFSHIVTLLAGTLYGTGFALFVGLLRCFLGAVFAGGMTAFLYGATGTILSSGSIWLCKKMFPRSVSLTGRSMVGAFFYDVGQVSLCALLMQSVYVFSYLPVLTLLAPFCGLLTGVAAKRTLAVFQK